MKRRDAVLRIGFAFGLIAAVLCLAPVILMVIVALSANWQQGFFAEGLTLRWLTRGWRKMNPYLRNSIVLAVRVLLADFLIGLPAVWAIARREFSGRRLLRSMTSLPVAVPGIAVALGLTIAFPQIRGSGALLFGAHVLYTLPFFIGSLLAPLERPQLIEMERVAVTLGASPRRVFLSITLPQVMLALVAASVVSFTLSMGEFNVSFFLVTPLKKTLPVELYSAYITDRLEVAAAYTIWFFVFVIPASVVIETVGGAKWGQT